MNAERIVSLVALVVFLLFLGVVGFSVRRVDLWIAILVGVGLVGYDLYTQLWLRRR